MQRPHRPASMTDRRLRALLKQLREDAAAPAQFSAQVLARLEQQGILPRVQAPRPALAERWAAWWRPASVGLALAGCLALLLLVRPQRPPVQVASPVAPPAVGRIIRPATKAVAKASSAQPAKVLARVPQAPAPLASVAPASQAALPVQRLETAIQPVPSQPAVGAAPAAAPAQSLRTSGLQPMQTADASAAGNPNKFSDSASRVRNNVIRASRGEAVSVDFYMLNSGPVRIDIIDRLGRSVAVLFDGQLQGNAAQASPYTYTWDGHADVGGMAASGIYLLRVRTPDYAQTHKLMLVK